MAETTSFVSNRHRECATCKFVSGCGLIGAGFYIAYHSKNLQKTIGKTIMMCIAGTTIGLGAARFFDFPPFRNQFDQD